VRSGDETGSLASLCHRARVAHTCRAFRQVWGIANPDVFAARVCVTTTVPGLVPQGHPNFRAVQISEKAGLPDYVVG
jgi:hypothetical protein